MPTGGWELSTWGATELRGEHGAVSIRPRERAVLAALAARSPAPASSDQIAEMVWGDAIPRTSRQAIQNHVARIRSVADDVILTTDGGYQLSSQVVVDALRRNDPHLADEGEPFADLADTVEVVGLRRAVNARRDESWFAAMSGRLDAGGDADALSEIERWVAMRPDNERGVWLRARALAAAGRRRDALKVIRSAHRRAADLGHASDRALLDLERRLLDDDPTLGGILSDDASVASDAEAMHDLRPSSGHVVGIDGVVERIERIAGVAATSLVAVTGSAGIGKTTIIDRLRARAAQRGEAFLVAACSPEPSVPLEPFTEILHQIAERFPGALGSLPDAEVLLSLAPTLRLSGDHRPPRARPDRSVLLAAIGDAVHCAPQPLVIAFEDLHWAGPLTLQMLRACVEVDQVGSPLTIVVTSRDATTELLEMASDHVAVEPWSLGTVEEYVGRFGRPAAWCRSAAEWVHRQSGGTALFIRELTLAAYATPDTNGFRPPETTPANLTASLRQTLQRLTMQTQRDLGAGAVLGRRFRTSEWAQMATDPATSSIESVSSGILEHDGPDVMVFRHDLLHRLVLESIAHGRRIELHDLALEAVQSSVAQDGATSLGSRLDELCRHGVGSHELDSDRAEALLLDAVAQDTTRFAYEAGIEKCRTGLALAGAHVVDRTTVAFEIALGGLLLRLGDAQALDQLLTAARHALDVGDDDLVAEAMREACRLGPTSVTGSVHDEAGNLLDRALAVVSDERASAILATAGVMLYAISGEDERCRRFFERAVSYRGDLSTRYQALGLAVLVLTKADDVDRCEEIERELAAAATELGSDDAAWSAVHLRMTNQVRSGDPAMRDTLVELGQLTTSLRQRTRLWEYTNWAASVALTDGDPDRAEALAIEALACIDAVAESLVMSAYGAQLLAIRHSQGRIGELVGVVQPIIDAGDPIGAWHGVLALAAAEAGDEGLARRELAVVAADDFAILDRDYTFNGALFVVALAASRLEDRDIARQVETELRVWSGRWAFVGTCTMGPIDAALARVVDLLGDRPSAIALAQAARDSARRAASPIYLADAESLLARWT